MKSNGIKSHFYLESLHHTARWPLEIKMNEFDLKSGSSVVQFPGLPSSHRWAPEHGP